MKGREEGGRKGEEGRKGDKCINNSVTIYRLFSGISFFTNTNFMVLYFAFWCYGMSSFAVAFIMSTFAKTPVKANILKGEIRGPRGERGREERITATVVTFVG
jgi:hypothetical protein